MNKKIKVLHIDSERSWRGGQQQAAYLLKDMYEHGYETGIVCRPASDFEKHCTDNNLPCFPIKMKGEFSVCAGYKIAKLCREHGYNILHLHTAHAMATGLYAKLFHKDLVLVGARRVNKHIKKNFLSSYKYRSPRMNRIVCISNIIRDVMLEDGIEEDKLKTIYSGIDLNRFTGDNPVKTFRDSLGIPEDNIVIGTVAAITHEKGYPTLLKAARKVLDENQKVTFLAVGTGKDEEEIHALSKELNLEGRFIFTGFRKDVGNFLNIFDIFVLASYQEGLGTSILDAQGLGLPVVACDTGGIPEIVHDDVNGLLVPVRDYGKLAEALLNLVKDENKRKEYGQKALETVKRFSIENTINNNIALYEELLSE